jgi:hypothetical protein
MLQDIQIRLNSISADVTGASQASHPAAKAPLHAAAPSHDSCETRSPAGMLASAAQHALQSGGAGNVKGGAVHNLPGWGPAPVPYSTPTSTGEMVDSAFLRNRNTSTWSTGIQGYRDS